MTSWLQKSFVQNSISILFTRCKQDIAIKYLQHLIKLLRWNWAAWFIDWTKHLQYYNCLTAHPAAFPLRSWLSTVYYEINSSLLRGLGNVLLYQNQYHYKFTSCIAGSRTPPGLHRGFSFYNCWTGGEIIMWSNFKSNLVKILIWEGDMDLMNINNMCIKALTITLLKLHCTTILFNFNTFLCVS